jgi:hypothetical protein
MSGNSYWDRDSTYYGALRPKEEFIKPEYKIQPEPHAQSPQVPLNVGNHHRAEATTPNNALSPTHQQLIADAHNHVHRLYQEYNLPIDQGTQNAVMSVAAVAAERDMNRIEQATVIEGNINLLQMKGVVALTASINGNVAANTAQEQSLNTLVELEQTKARTIHSPVQQLEQHHPVRSMV